jgi:MoaA/NifB/PqqE/SkfB family radical SAM enzyme
MPETTRSKIHVINELPHIYELEDLIEFCKKYERLYIYGAAENQEYLLKFLDICNIPVEGYVVSSRQAADQCLQYRNIPIVAIDEILSQKDIGIILGLSDRHYGYIIPKFRQIGFHDYFIMTEYNKRTIAAQMKPRPLEEMTFEVNLADHCNLDCQMCDHYSQLADKHFLDVDSFERDMSRMGEIFDHRIACITLLGGEPTLHKDIIRCMEIARCQFPLAEIIILTNGLLLLRLENAPQGNIWQACRDYNVHITVTVYPLNFDYEALEKKAAEYGVSLAMSSNIHANQLTKIVKISDKHTFDLSGSVGKHYFINCLYFNKFNVLKDGRLYMCPVAAHSGIFNRYFNQNLELTDKDSLDIYKVSKWEELAEFSANIIPFCRYCDLKNWHGHSEWKRSTKEMDEYI